VRVEFEGDEVFWALQENYTFEMLLMDAARYWDVSPEDAVLADERGAIWPDDAYVALELVTAPSARIALRIKATATVDDDEAEYYGNDDDGSELSEEEEQDFMAIAVAAEDALLLAQARGGVASLTDKQKIALKRKMKRELVSLSASPFVRKAARWPVNLLGSTRWRRRRLTREIYNPFAVGLLLLLPRQAAPVRLPPLPVLGGRQLVVFRIVNRPLMAFFASIGLFLLFPFLLHLLLRLSHAVDLLPQCFQLILGLGIVSRPKRLLQLVNPFLNLRTLGLQRLRAQGHALIPGLLLGFQLGFQLFLLLLQRLVALLKLGVIVAMHLHRRLHYAIPHLLSSLLMTSCVRAAVAAALSLSAS